MPAVTSGFAVWHDPLSGTQAVGIPLALIGAVLMSLGAQFQHRGVTKMEQFRSDGEVQGLGVAQLLALFGRPSWVSGTVMIGAAILFQLSAIRFSPLTVVQPIGAVSLVITALVNARVSRTPLNRGSVRAIALCIAGVAVFVTVAAIVTPTNPPDVTDTELLVVLALLVLVAGFWGVLFWRFRSRMRPTAYIVGAGMLYAFVVTIVKVVMQRILQEQFDWLTGVLLLGLLVAGGGGAYFVQVAYSVGPPDLVVAGLTVVDPLVAVTIGIVVLQETAGAPWWTTIVFLASGAVAVWGVYSLARHHPSLDQPA